ncbi:MAG: hypothetical protein GWN71_25645, partial [Gammaproteobacteria bacterium]|nr:hypothetical protein [Gemmatimonadota bacterium]NIU76818.1 hypothetical protein [Gammaproteobacteria bacterium]NIY10531.1 hypothetical protein [Gemmatimonadota bacterium]
MRLNGAAFRLVGLTSGTNLLATQLAFVDLEAAARWTSYMGQASFLALATDGDPTEVADRIRAGHGKVTVLATPEFVRRNLDEVGAGFRPMQLLVSIIGLAA